MKEFSRSDYLRIKWSFVALTASLAVGIGLFAGLRMLNEKAVKQLQQATTTYNDAKQKVEKISQEDASIRANIGQYQIIKDTGMVGPEDRLQMQENFTSIRAQYNLFPITYILHSQNILPLRYGELDGKKVDNPGRPISIQVTDIDFKLPMLHENDLANLLTGLQSRPEFLQVHDCKITSNIARNKIVLRLAQHLNAECLLTWYTFHIGEIQKPQERRK